MDSEIKNKIAIKKFGFLRFFKRLILGAVIFLVTTFSMSVLLVYIYEDDVKALIIKELNKHLNSKITVEPQNIDLTIIQSFPKCALEFKNILAFESKDFKTQDTLLYAKRLSLAFDIKNLLNKNYTINKIELEDSKINLKINKEGNPNYIIWKTSTNNNNKNDSVKFELENIHLKNVFLKYKNNQEKIKITTTLNEINFYGKFKEKSYLLQAKGLAYMELFQVQKVRYLNQKKLKLDLMLDVNGNNFRIVKSETKINETFINTNGSFELNDSLINLDLAVKGNKLDISSTLSLLPESFQHKINDYESEGIFYAEGECHYQNGKPFTLTSKFGMKGANVTYKPNKATLNNINLEGSVLINAHQSVLKLSDISANMKGNTFNGNVEVINFNDPFLKFQIDAKTNLEDLMTFYPIDTLQYLTGNISLNASIEGKISELKSKTFSSNIIANGSASLLNIKAQFKNSEKEINIPGGEVKLNLKNLEVTNLNLIKGNSDITIVGDIPNFLEYVFNSKSNLTINSTVSSNNVELEDFIFESQASSKKSTVLIPDNLELNIVLNFKKLTFKKFNASLLSGKLFLKNQKIALNDLSFLAMNGNVSLNALADATNNDVKISGSCNVGRISIKELFYQLNNFGQATLQDKHLKGFATANIDFSGVWDRQLNVDLNTINATSNVLIERGELIEFKPLESLANYIDMNELKHIKFSSLQSSIQIKNKTIILPKTSIKSTAINLELWGQQTFDNQIDYHIQLLISELLAKRSGRQKNFDEELSLIENDPENRRSIFILMTGPIDNPKIKYDSKGVKQKIKEDFKQEKQNLKQLLKEEFGLFNKDSVSKTLEKSNQKFQIKIGENDAKKEKALEPKKKEIEDEDF